MVKTWRARYERDRLEGLRDLPKSGRPLTFAGSAIIGAKSNV